MRRELLAEWILSLVTDREHAASTIGDLIEEAPANKPVWFWNSLMQTAISLLWNGITAAPFQMILGAAIVWLVYVFVSFALSFGATVAVSLVWGIAYFAEHHTALELLAEWTQVHVPWPSPRVWDWVSPVMWWAVAPFQVGQWVVCSSKCPPLTQWLVIVVVWQAMKALMRAHLPPIPVVEAALLLGMLWAHGHPSSGSRRPAH